MPKTVDELFTEQNLWLFDILFRHQVYLEGWKTGLSNGYKQFLDTLYTEFSRYLKQTRYQRIDQFTKIALTDFIRRFTLAQTKFYSSYTNDLINILQQFLTVDVGIHKDIMQAVTGRTVVEANSQLKGSITQAEYDALTPGVQSNYERRGDGWALNAAYPYNAYAGGIYGIAVVDGTKDGESRLWVNITNSPIPANGLLLLKMLDEFGSQSSARVQALIRKAYANSWTVDQLEQAILSDGGLFGLLLAQHAAIIATAVQHISSEAQAAVASVYYERYQWVAILDNRTTVICRERNGIVYVYGEGPLPPAHYNCRSKAVSVSSDQHIHDIPDSYFDWLKTQPEWFLVDVLGQERAKLFQAGDLLPGNFAQISTIKPLTLSEFQGKIKYILGAS